MLKTGEEIHKLAVAQTVWISSPNASSQNLRFPKSLKCRQDGNIQLRVPFEPASLYNSPYAFSHTHNGFCSLQRVPDQITVWQDFIWLQEQHNR